jgi:ribokinase
MPKILVSGLINFETTLKIDKFPIDYFPVAYPFGGVNSTVSGVGFNVAKALKILGAEVSLLSITGADIVSRLIETEMEKCGLGREFIVKSIQSTPQSVIIFDETGKRQIHVDLKDIQQAVYPPALFAKAARGADILVLCNINFSRPMLAEGVKAGRVIACDVHALSPADCGGYNADFIRGSDILFFSDENIGGAAEDFIRHLTGLYPIKIIAAGMGAKGALLYVKKDDCFRHYPALNLRPVVNTVGAGDSLFSAFVYYYAETRDPYFAMERASVFAAWKVGANGGAEGFLSAAEMMRYNNS